MEPSPAGRLRRYFSNPEPSILPYFNCRDHELPAPEIQPMAKFYPAGESVQHSSEKARSIIIRHFHSVPLVAASRLGFVLSPAAEPGSKARVMC